MTSAINDQNSAEYKKFQNVFLKNVRTAFEDGELEHALGNITLHSVDPVTRQVNFSVHFHKLDGYEMLFLQDSIEKDGSLGKLEVVKSFKPTYGLSEGVPSGRPTNVKVHATSPNAVTISWVDVPGMDNYVIFYKNIRTQSFQLETYGAANNPANLTWLMPGTTYAFFVVGYVKNVGNGISSEIRYCKTHEKVPKSAPSITKVEAQASSYVSIEWYGIPRDDFNGEPLGYFIQVYSNETLQCTFNVSAMESNYVIKRGLTPSTPYVISVCAYNNMGRGPHERASVTTKPSPPTLPPRNFTESLIKSHDHVEMSWQMPPTNGIHGDLMSYIVIARPTSPQSTARLAYYPVHGASTSVLIEYLEANTEYNVSIAALNQFGIGEKAQIITKTCQCPATVSSNYYLLPPYLHMIGKKMHGVFYEVLKQMIPQACGICNRAPGQSPTTSLDMYKNGRGSYSLKINELRVILNMDEHTDLSFPIIGTKNQRYFMGYPYVSLVDYPGAVLIVKDKTLEEIVSGKVWLMMCACWPLLLLMLLMSVAMSLLVWLLESSSNRNQKTPPESSFDYSLVKGTKESWYWSIITLGTQGYGDFAPQSYLGRACTITWMFISLITCALFTAAIIATLSSPDSSSKAQLYGKMVGALNGSFEQKIALQRNGKVNQKNIYTSIHQLQKALSEGEIEVVILDAFTAGTHKLEFQHSLLRVAKVLDVPRTYGFVLSGDLANSHDKFRSYVKDNENLIFEILKNSTTPITGTEPYIEKSIMDPSSEVLKHLMVTMGGILFVLYVLGCLYDYINRRKDKKHPEIMAMKKLERDKIAMEQFVTDFVNRYTKTIENILSKHDSQIGTHIIIQRLFKCKTRLSKACCPPRDDCESQELLVWYEVDNDKTLIRKGGNAIEEEKPPDPPKEDDTFLNEVLTHLYHIASIN
ncbi:uncharacterized protein [Clytia hemisphaerica]|uniref:Fibronectin type-III domain-containing protein n=1 Tax=Clytia hemisphaerica TaxID=252671 RepID=A0A7M5UZU7_9CNID